MARGSWIRFLSTLAEFRLSRESAFNVLKTDTRGNGNAIPLVDAEMRYLVVVILKQFPREIIVLALRLLNSQDVYIGTSQPILNTVGAVSKRVHIPGCNLH